VTDVVIGMGQVGKPLHDILSMTYDVAGVDIDFTPTVDGVEALHICFPFGTAFAEQVSVYVKAYEPQLVIVHSTVLPSTTRDIAEFVKPLVAYSPVRGRHSDMHRHLMFYTKFVAGVGGRASLVAHDHLRQAKFRVKVASSPETLELAKLIDTAYAGLLIAWAQELDRFCQEVDVDFEEVARFWSEWPWRPKFVHRPGYIRGHCILPNLELLRQLRESPIIDAIIESNAMCTDEQKEDTDLLRPIKL